MGGRRLRLVSVSRQAHPTGECPTCDRSGRDGCREYLRRAAALYRVPWFWSDQFDVKLQIAGLNASYDHVVVRRDGRPGAASHWYFRGNTLLAVDAMNDARNYMIAKRLLALGISPDPGSVSNPATDLGHFLKSHAPAL
jgi:Reductase C-terminal